MFASGRSPLVLRNFLSFRAHSISVFVYRLEALKFNPGITGELFFGAKVDVRLLIPLFTAAVRGFVAEFAEGIVVIDELIEFPRLSIGAVAFAGPE